MLEALDLIEVRLKVEARAHHEEIRRIELLALAGVVELGETLGAETRGAGYPFYAVELGIFSH